MILIELYFKQFNFELLQIKFAIDTRRKKNPIESSHYKIGKCTPVGYRWPLVGLISENQTRNRNKKKKKTIQIFHMSARCQFVGLDTCDVRMRMLLVVDIERLCAIIYRQWRHQRNTSDKSRTNILRTRQSVYVKKVYAQASNLGITRSRRRP